DGGASRPGPRWTHRRPMARSGGGGGPAPGSAAPAGHRRSAATPAARSLPVAGAEDDAVVGEDVRVALLERGARGDGAVAAGDARQRGDRQVVLAAVHLVAGGGAVRGAVHEDGVPAAVLAPQAAPAVLGRRDDVVEGRVGLAAGELHLGQLHLLPLGAVPAVHAGLGALAAHREDVVLGDGGQRPVHGGGGVVAPDLAVEEGRPVPAVDRL